MGPRKMRPHVLLAHNATHAFCASLRPRARASSLDISLQCVRLVPFSDPCQFPCLPLCPLFLTASSLLYQFSVQTAGLGTSCRRGSTRSFRPARFAWQSVRRRRQACDIDAARARMQKVELGAEFEGPVSNRVGCRGLVDRHTHARAGRRCGFRQVPL